MDRPSVAVTQHFANAHDVRQAVTGTWTARRSERTCVSAPASAMRIARQSP